MDKEGLHPGRKSIRQKNHDYAAAASYFVTICTDGKRFLFGTVLQGSVELTELGRIARENWVAMPSHFAIVNLHAFVVMPNHVHGIIEIGRLPSKGRSVAAPLTAQSRTSGEKRVVEKGVLGQRLYARIRRRLLCRARQRAWLEGTGLAEELF